MPPFLERASLETPVPDALTEYFTPEMDALDGYLSQVASAGPAGAGDGALGPVSSLPWLYVPDLTGWRGGCLARCLASERGRQCVQLPAVESNRNERLRACFEASRTDPLVLHVEVTGDGRRLGVALQEVFSSDSHGSASTDDAAARPESPLIVLITDTSPSKRIDAPLPLASQPSAGAVLSYAPRQGMVPDCPDGTTFLPEPPALHARTDELEALLVELFPESSSGDEIMFAEFTAEALSITHSLIGKRDLLFDVSPRAALKYGFQLDSLGLDRAKRRLKQDILGQIPQTPGSDDLRATLGDLLEN